MLRAAGIRFAEINLHACTICNICAHAVECRWGLWREARKNVRCRRIGPLGTGFSNDVIRGGRTHVVVVWCRARSARAHACFSHTTSSRISGNLYEYFMHRHDDDDGAYYTDHARCRRSSRGICKQIRTEIIFNVGMDESEMTRRAYVACTRVTRRQVGGSFTYSMKYTMSHSQATHATTTMCKILCFVLV